MFKVPQPGRSLEISALVLRSSRSLILLGAESGRVHDVSGHFLVLGGDEQPFTIIYPLIYVLLLKSMT